MIGTICMDLNDDLSLKTMLMDISLNLICFKLFLD